MGIPIKTEQEIAAMRKSCRILAEVLAETAKKCQPGISTKELDLFAEKLIIEKGGKPAFKGYHGFPATLCTARNEVIVHGIPREDEFLEEGDIFTIDCGVIYEGMYSDAARSLAIGKVDSVKARLLETAHKAFNKAVEIIKPDIFVDEISTVIENTIKEAGFYVIYDLTGHGIGRNLHEEPLVLNFHQNKPTPRLHAGMTIAVEPIFSSGTHYMTTLEDDWTVITEDHSPAVQYENTILITEKGAEILTKI